MLLLILVVLAQQCAKFSIAFHPLDDLTSRGFYPEVVIDVGANIGNEDLSDRLKKTDYPFEIGVLAAKSGETLVFYTSKKDAGKTGSSIFKEDTGAFGADSRGGSNLIEHKVITKTLDEILAQRGLLGKVSFLKLDIQGAEIEALKGATNLLKTTDFILSEVSMVQYNKGAPSFAKIVFYMNKLGFVLYDINEFHRLRYNKQGKFLIQMDILWVKKTSYFHSRVATGFDPILEESYDDL